ncbi:MAG TPA: precorrin-6y C5,15-methyltransferase (decarboxylating) subunit CbiE, partial [Acidimicrobiales bacterium]|nr:precorrin-6y C5,15-methyltransferase (decarboxylating) subunit CbiE [Acidimicrobiales bacterium]
MPDQPGTVTVIGIAGYGLDHVPPAASRALDGAGLVLGGRRHLEAFEARQRQLGGSQVRSVPIGRDADDACRHAAAASGQGTSVCVLASGDPGFFGIVRALLRVIDRKHLVIVPAPSSVSLAFARIGLPWDDATVISAHGRPLADAIGAIRVSRKVAVLTSPESPPEAVGKALVTARAAVDVVAVCSRLGHPDESVTMVGLDDLATGAWDPLSVVILLGPAGRRIAGWGGAADDAKPLAWGLPDDAYGHRDGMITKSEVRAVALGKLALPPTGVLWDVGAGSGSVAVECASLSPGLVVFAIEEREDDVARISENASRFGVGVTTVHGHVPEACEGLPDPDRVFVGGGGLAALDLALTRLRPGGGIVATFAALDRAAEAAGRLGNLVQVSVSRG